MWARDTTLRCLSRERTSFAVGLKSKTRLSSVQKKNWLAVWYRGLYALPNYIGIISEANQDLMDFIFFISYQWCEKIPNQDFHYKDSLCINQSGWLNGSCQHVLQTLKLILGRKRHLDSKKPTKFPKGWKKNKSLNKQNQDHFDMRIYFQTSS